MSIVSITIISEIEDLISFVHEYAANINACDFGYKNCRLTDMPKVYDALQKWEDKNVSVLSPENKECFYEIKKCIEKFMDHFNIDSIEVLIKK